MSSSPQKLASITQTQTTAIFNGTFHETSVCQNKHVFHAQNFHFWVRIHTSLSNCCTNFSVTLSNIFVEMLALITHLDKAKAF